MKTSAFGLLLVAISIASCKKDNTQSNKTFGLMETPSNTLAAVSLASPMSFGGNIPAFYMLEMPPVGNQGGEGSCVAWATAYACRSYQRDENYYNTNGTMDYSKVCSPEYVYNQIKVGGCADGAYFVSHSGYTGALDLLKAQGVCSWADMPYSDNGCSTLPNTNQQSAAQGNKISQFERIVDFTTNNLKILLLNRYPIIIGARLDQGFMGADENFIWDGSNGGFVGNHAMVVCGWDDNKNAFKLINSWGENWGDNGFTWLDYNYFSTVVFEAYITTPVNGNNPIVPIDGLVAYYPFNGNTNDESGNNHNCTSNEVTLVSDRKGNSNKAYSFNGTTSYITGAIPNMTELTVSFWFKNSDTDFNRYEKFFSFGVEDLNAGIQNSYDQSANCAGSLYSYASNNNGSASTPCNSAPNYSNGQWHHAVMQYAVGVNGYKIYVDGSLAAELTIANAFNTFNYLDIGRSNAPCCGYFQGTKYKGELDDFRIYSRILTSSEILALYNE